MAMQDPCGVAGGTPQASFNAAEYTTTKFAKQGDYGTVVLKPRPMGVMWKRGSTASVRFQLTANHGGGCTSPLRIPAIVFTVCKADRKSLEPR